MRFCGPTNAAGERPRFSVVIPALNERSVLGACLSALAAQRYADEVQVIVVDNGSEDDTAAVAAGWGAQVVVEPQRGVCAARQRGLLAATGDIVISTDADTTTSPDWLSGIDDRFRADDRVVGVAGACQYVDGPRWAVWWPRVLFGLVAAIYRLTGRVLYVSATNLAFRRDSFDGYDVRLTQGGDELDVLRRLHPRGKVVFSADHPTTTSARRLQQGLLYSLVVSLAYYYVLGYWLNRLTGKTVLGMAPAFRPTGGRRRRIPWLVRIVGVLTLVLIAAGIGWYEDVL